MKRRLTFCAVALVLLAVAWHIAPLRADQKQHPIDAWLDRALAKDSSTHGMRQATHRAEILWDQELNRAYAGLKARLSRTQASALARSQRAWLAFRDAEFHAIEQTVGRKEGTMWWVVADQKRLEVVRARALQLESLKQSLEE